MLYRTENPHGGDVYGKNKILLDYSANTNPFGTPEGVLEAIRACLPELHRYPDPYCRSLVRAISEFERVPEDFVLCGSGAAELIYSYCEAVKPASAAEPAPTFSEYSLGLSRIGCTAERYVLDSRRDFELDKGFLEHLKSKRPEAVFLCNPNNPTGRLIAYPLLEEILLLCRELNSRLLVDECFLDLADGGISLKKYLGDFPQLLILKAFTKSYGMAGVRLGYCLSSDSRLLGAMSKTCQPWNVSAPAQAAGVAALRESGFLKKTRELIPIERERLRRGLERLGFKVCPSDANFLLFKGPEGLREALLEQGVQIRSCANFCGLGPGWYRIAVRLHSENEMLMDAMKLVCGKEQ